MAMLRASLTGTFGQLRSFDTVELLATRGVGIGRTRPDWRLLLEGHRMIDEDLTDWISDPEIGRRVQHRMLFPRVKM